MSAVCKSILGQNVSAIHQLESQGRKRGRGKKKSLFIWTSAGSLSWERGSTCCCCRSRRSWEGRPSRERLLCRGPLQSSSPCGREKPSSSVTIVLHKVPEQLVQLATRKTSLCWQPGCFSSCSRAFVCHVLSRLHLSLSWWRYLSPVHLSASATLCLKFTCAFLELVHFFICTLLLGFFSPQISVQTLLSALIFLSFGCWLLCLPEAAGLGPFLCWRIIKISVTFKLRCLVIGPFHRHPNSVILLILNSVKHKCGKRGCLKRGKDPFHSTQSVTRTNGLRLSELLKVLFWFFLKFRSIWSFGDVVPGHRVRPLWHFITRSRAICDGIRTWARPLLLRLAGSLELAGALAACRPRTLTLASSCRLSTSPASTLNPTRSCCGTCGRRSPLCWMRPTPSERQYQKKEKKKRESRCFSVMLWASQPCSAWLLQRYLGVMGAHRSVALERAAGVAVAGVGKGVVFDLVVPRLY